MTSKTIECDVCIIGAGAGGAVVANECVQSGLNVVAIDEGPLVTESGSYRKVMIRSAPAWARQPFGGGWGKIAYPWSSRNVGGGTIFYGAASFRYRKIDFNIEDVLTDHCIPLRWPYSYDELAPYYDEMERLLNVSGNNSLDPTFPGSSCATLLAPHPYSPEATFLIEPSMRMGLHPFPTPLAISSEVTRKASRTEMFVEEYSDSGARRDAYSTFLQPLSDNGHFTLLSDTRAEELHQEVDGRISMVRCLSLPDKQQIEIRAKIFVASANAIQTAAILLRSRNNKSPLGIGNENDLVGRYLCLKMSEYVVGIKPNTESTNTYTSNQGVFSTVSWTDLYQSESLPLGLGGLIYEARYGFPYINCKDYSVVRLECILADQPAYYNQVFSIDGDIGIDFQSHPLDLARLEAMAKHCEDILKNAGCVHIRREPSAWYLGSTHLHGTCRAGLDPKFSVVNEHCRMHSIENLYVADGSFMPYPGSMNPTLTIQANALRTARLLLKDVFGQKTATPY